MRTSTLQVWKKALVIILVVGALLSSCSQIIVSSEGESPTPVESTAPPAPSPGVLRTTPVEGISFDLDPALAAGVEGLVIPENPGAQDGPYWEVHPQYVSISLDGYPLTATQMKPGIYVYPVEDYGRLSSLAGETLQNLQDLLTKKPSDADQLPFLPILNAGQVFHSNIDWVDFQNGSGVRFLTIYAQYPAPVNNFDIFYTFQGLTNDGRYSVSAIFPVSHPSLPTDLNALSQSEMDGILQDYDLYRADMAAALSTPEGSGLFTPDLARLDALVASLAVDRWPNQSGEGRTAESGQ